MSYKPEVQTDNTGAWCGNALRFATEQEAHVYVADLAMRWTLVRDVRVVPSEDDVSARIVKNRLELWPWEFRCELCGQHITDGKPCGCGARG
jgi:hypothetical protein